MKKLIYISFLSILFVNCNSQMSLQKYMAKNSENPNFLAIDLGSNVLKIEPKKLSKDEKELFKTIKKLNVLLFRKTTDNLELYQQEKDELKDIFNENSQYEKLLQASDKGKKVTFYSVGSGDFVDEIVLFADDNNIGFAIVRLLGKKINPANMMNFMSLLQKADINDELQSFFDSIESK